MEKLLTSKDIALSEVTNGSGMVLHHMTRNKEMSMRKYSVGDIVRLKSGGPKMTVEVMQNRGFYTCSWFVRTEIKSWVFHENALMPATDEKK